MTSTKDPSTSRNKNRDGPRVPIKFHPLEKVNTNADCLEKQFTLHDLCKENHRATLFVGGNKYRNLALQVGGV
jgi:hypothetical protein